MKKLLLLLFLIPIIGFSQPNEDIILKAFTNSKTYKTRVYPDAGKIRSDYVTKAFYMMSELNGMATNIQFAWLGESASKFRTSTIYNYFTKLYSTVGTNDATQTTELNQPYLSGNIAPNERYAMKNTNGGTKSVTHTGIVVSGTYTVTTVEQTELTGKYIITHTELTTGTLTTITPSGRLAAKIIRSTALTTDQKLAESNFFRSIYPEIETVKIGTQNWATSNLEMVYTPMGNPISNVTDNTVWAASTTTYDATYAATSGTIEQKTYAAVKASAMWSYYNNNAALGAIYGKLYNWYAAKLLQMDIDYYNAANPATLCGYRVPTSTDFTTLQTTLGGSTIAGGKMKKEGLNYWNTPNTGATNSSGFSGLGGGNRSIDGIFSSLNNNIAYWNNLNNTIYYLESNNGLLSSITALLERGYSIRLIKN